MLRVPEQHRGEDQDGQDPARPEPPVAQPGPRLRIQQQPEQQADPQEGGGVFRQQRGPGEEAHRQPPAPVPAGMGLGDRPEGQAPEDDLRRVRRHQHGAGIHQQRGVEQRGRHHPRAPVGKQEVARPHQGQRGQQQPDGAEQPDAQRCVAQQQRPRPDPEGDHGRMVVVAGRKRPGPDPVVGLVRRDRHGGRGDQPGQGDGCQGQQRRQQGLRAEGLHHRLFLSERARPVSRRRHSSRRR
ncbi:hypothetical protein ROMU108268_02240 [Roseomonas mucosa]